MSLDNLRHAQYSVTGTQIDDPQDIYPSSQTAGPYTWATKPLAGSNTGLVIRVTDVGTAGSGGSHWISDGTYWRPVNGSVVLAAQKGSITTPVSTITGVIAGAFVHEAINVPAGCLVPGRSQLEFMFKVRRVGATATAILSSYMGTAKSSASDANMSAFFLAAATNYDSQSVVVIEASEVGRVLASNYANWGGTGSGAVFNDRTTNINTLAEMGITMGIASANAADSFSLLSYELKLYS